MNVLDYWRLPLMVALLSPAIAQSATVAIASTRGSTANGGCAGVIPSSDIQSMSGTGPQSAGARISGASVGGRCAVLVEASATKDGLQATADMVFSGYGSAAGYVAAASYQSDDFLLTGGPTGATVTTAATFGFDGLATAYLTPGTNGNLRGNTRASADAQISISGAGLPNGSASINASLEAFANGGNPAGTDLASGALTTAPFELVVGTPFTVDLQLIVRAQGVATRGTVSPFVGLDGGAIGDFDSTLWFSKTGPVFDLPAGYTVNSAGAGIVDNFATTTIPAPPAFYLFLSALAWLSCKVRRLCLG